MRKHVSWAVAAATVLAACGGKKSDAGSSGLTSAVVVDPYISGAVLQEVTADRRVVQESGSSGQDGAATFPSPLSKGNLVLTAVKGQHNGLPYAVQLKRKVDALERTLVVSPITTLLAEDQLTPAQVVSMLNAATGGGLTFDDLATDPMARVLDGSITAEDRKLLAATIGTSAALQVLRGNVAGADLAAIVTEVAAKALVALEGSGSPQACASAAAAIGEYAARSAASLADVQRALAAVDGALISQLVQAAASGTAVAIVDDGAGGGAHVGYSVGTVAEHLAKGMAALQAGLSSASTDELLEAVNRFSAAAAAVSTDTTASQADVDRARAFGGIARVGLLAQPYSDLVANNGLNDLGDLLDGFGLGGTPFQRRNLDTIELLSCTESYYPYYYQRQCELKKLAPDSPRSSEVQAFLANQLRSGLTAAIGMLEAVTASFSSNLSVGGRVVDLDSTDVLFVDALAHAMVAEIDVQQAYDLDVDLDELQTNVGLRTPNGEHLYQVSDFLRDNPNFLRLQSAATLPGAREHALGAVRAARRAVASLRAETDDQSDDLVQLADESCTYDPTTWVYSCTTTYNAADELARLDRHLAEAEAAVVAPGAYALTLDTPDTGDDVTVDVNRFFSGLDLRSLIPTSFTFGLNGDRAGPFPDVTFGGVLVASPLDLNADEDADGSPDVFGGYTYFFDGFLADGPFNTYGWFPNGWASGSCSFEPTGRTFTWTRSESTFGTYIDGVWTPGVTTVSTYSGAYAYDRNVLTLTFAGAGPGQAATVTIVASRFDGSSFDGQTVTYQDGTGAVLPGYGDSWWR